MLYKISGKAVQFQYQVVLPGLKERQKLKQFILSIFTQEKQEVSSLAYIFCTDDYLVGINKQFLQHNYFTDILTFNLAAKNAPVQGEIYISIDRVRENARTYHQPVFTELHRVMFHGALHLCGYRDKSAAEVKTMRKIEDLYLKQYFK